MARPKPFMDNPAVAPTSRAQEIQLPHNTKDSASSKTSSLVQDFELVKVFSSMAPDILANLGRTLKVDLALANHGIVITGSGVRRAHTAVFMKDLSARLQTQMVATADVVTPHDVHKLLDELLLGTTKETTTAAQSNATPTNVTQSPASQSSATPTTTSQSSATPTNVTPTTATPATPSQEDSRYLHDNAEVLATPNRRIKPRTKAQADFIRTLAHHEIVLAVGSAGTGKTYLAIAFAVSLLQKGLVHNIVLSRPAVEAGEKLGFLPGGLHEKVDPYLRPLYDALYDMLPAKQVARYLESGRIEVAPVAFMRGRTLSDCVAIFDEAQNATPEQIKMFLTRMGDNCRLILTGDPTQSDLPDYSASGLLNAVNLAQHIPQAALVRFAAQDSVRHPIVARIIKAYNDGKHLSPAKAQPREDPASPATKVKCQ